MVSGAFLGGAATGIAGAERRGLARQSLGEDVRLREQGLGLQERGLALREQEVERLAGRQAQADAAKDIELDLKTMVGILDNGIAAGTGAKALNAVNKLIDSSTNRLVAAGRDPEQLKALAAARVEAAPPTEAQRFTTALQGVQQPAPAQTIQAGAPAATPVSTTPASVRGGIVPPATVPDAPQTVAIRPTEASVAAALRLTELGDVAGAKKLIKEDIKDQASRDPLAGRFKDPKQKFDAEQGLRKEFLGASKDFITVRNSFERVKSSLNTGAGDVALVFNFMKMLDPNSVVRESEFATAENTGSIPEGVWQQFNRAKTGQRLAPGVRKRFKDQAAALFKKQIQQHQRRSSLYGGLAEANGLAPKNVAIDIGGRFAVDAKGRVIERVK